jgi:hypothetical protein
MEEAPFGMMEASELRTSLGGDDGLAQSRVVVEEDRPPHVELLFSQF